MTTHVAWIDLETTGTDEDRDPILEVGLIVTDMKFRKLRTMSWVIRPDGLDALQANADPYVQKMHKDNGLWEACAQLGRLLDEVDLEVANFLVSVGSGPFALAGSGVAHFDRRFIAAQMPLLDKRLTYWSLDVGVVRRFLTSAGRPDLVPEAGKGANKPHRALDDIELHLIEGQHYLRVLNEQGPKNPSQLRQEAVRK